LRYRVGIITISDKGSRGEREDRSGPLLRKLLEEEYDVSRMLIVPDETEEIAKAIIRLVEEGLDIVITTGGTGVTERDVTPEATRMVIDRELPGFSEIMRIKSYEITPHGIISRGVCGTRKASLIINLPGSPKAASECLSFVLPAIPHTLEKLKGDETDCGEQA
jgi:molybdenum cofactor synthesis domain-containing protein